MMEFYLFWNYDYQDYVDYFYIKFRVEPSMNNRHAFVHTVMLNVS